MTCGHAPRHLSVSAGRRQADVRCLSRLPSQRPPLAGVSDGLRQPSPGPRGFETPAPSHDMWDGGSAMPRRGFCRASPLSSSAQTSGPFLSILWFSSSLVSCLDCSSPWAMCPRVPVSLRLFSPRKALQLWVSGLLRLSPMEASLKASGAHLPPPPSSRPAHPAQPPTTGPCRPCFSGGAHAMSAWVGSSPLRVPSSCPRPP